MERFVSVAAGDLAVQIALSNIGFGGPDTLAQASGSGTWSSSTSGSTLTLKWYNDPDNGQGAQTPTDLPGQLVHQFSSTTFSMTFGLDFTLKPNTTLFNTGMSLTKQFAPVPEPTTSVLLGLGFLVTRLRSRKPRQR